MTLASDEDGDGDALEALQFSLASDIVELVVLTRDDVFLQTLREAVGGARRLWHVLSAEKVSDLLIAGEVGIVVLDVAAMHDAASVFVSQIKRQFPDLVVVVAGSRDTEIALAGLISAGIVYRFIHKPVSPGRARLFAEAAVRKYGEQRLLAAVPERNAPARNYLALSAAAVVALAFLGAIVWTLRGGSRQQSVAQPSLQAGRAAALSPADPQARLGLADVRDRLLARAENALLEERLDEAAAAIETARQAGVESGRIAFLSAQLAKLKDQVRAAQAARSRAAAKTTVAAAADDRVAALVDLATQRLAVGKLVDPEHDSARYYTAAALSIDPNDAAAQDTQRELAMRLLREARAGIDRRDFAQAAQRLQDADGIAAPANIETLQALLAGARQEAQADALARLRESEQLHENDNAKMQREPDAEAGQQKPLSDLVPASQLTLVKSVQPVYPAKALDRGIEGWVELDLTVAQDGLVQAVAVHAASSPGVFDNAAVKAVSQWRFRPVLRDQEPTPVRTRVRIRFAAP